MTEHLISLEHLTEDQIMALLDQALLLKTRPGLHRDALQGRSVGLIFQKPSNRTRVSFEVGVHQLGGNCLYLGPEEINLGKRETTADVAATLSRYLDAIVARTFRHEDIVELAATATIPIINGLSDLYHPCQALADLLSVKERFGSFAGLTFAYIGDGNNVCHSLLLGCAKVGLALNVATPAGYEPDPAVLATAMQAARAHQTPIRVMRSPQDAVDGAQVIYTDVWTSMGQEEEREQRLRTFADFQINAALTARAHPEHIFMHCLPAHRGEEVTAEVIDGPHSIVFDQAENRLHAQKAVLLSLMKNNQE